MVWLMLLGVVWLLIVSLLKTKHWQWRIIKFVQDRANTFVIRRVLDNLAAFAVLGPTAAVFVALFLYVTDTTFASFWGFMCRGPVVTVLVVYVFMYIGSVISESRDVQRPIKRDAGAHHRISEDWPKSL